MSILRAARQLLEACAVVALTAVAACEPILTDEREPLRGNVTIDLRAPSYGAVAASSAIRGTMIDSLVLTITHAGELPTAIHRKLARTDTIVSFPIQASEGINQFDVQVFSGIGRLLFAGTASLDVTGPNFQVQPILVPQAPIMRILPDSVRLGRAIADSSVVVSNRGLSSLVWTIVSCSPAGVPCVGVTPTSGQLAQLDSLRLVIRTLDVSGVYVLTFVSAEGQVPVTVVVQ
jgi:hypothetical protein